jgi:hypothetical protein
MRIAAIFDDMDGLSTEAGAIKASSARSDFSIDWREKKLTEMSCTEVEKFFDEMLWLLSFDGPEH